MTQPIRPSARFIHSLQLPCRIYGCSTVGEPGLLPDSPLQYHAAPIAPPLKNPANGTTDWYHGTHYDPAQDENDEHAHDGGTIRPPVETGHGEGDEGRHAEHWNTDLGSHFTSLRGVAEQFATGRYAQPEHSRVLTAGLHMANPKHFDSEEEMADHAIDWAHKNGHQWLQGADSQKRRRFAQGDYGYDARPGDEDDEHLGEHMQRYHDHIGGFESEINKIDLHGPKAPGVLDSTKETWLGEHPDRENVTSGYVDHLRSQGHDGITYGNSIEGPKGHTCAIAFDDTPVHHRKWTWTDAEQDAKHRSPQAREPEGVHGQEQMRIRTDPDGSHSLTAAKTNLRVAVRLTPGITREASVSVCQEVTDLGYRMRMDDVDTGERLGSLQYANEGGTLRFWAVQAVNPSVARAMVEAAKTADRKLPCHECNGTGTKSYEDRSWECRTCGGSGTFHAADHWDSPQVHPEQQESTDYARNPLPGTTVWRGEIRHKDHISDPPSVGMHWTTNPNQVILGRSMPEDHVPVLWEGRLDRPSEQAIPRSHPIWSGKHRSMDSEAEVRIKPGETVHVTRAFHWTGDKDERGEMPNGSGMPYPHHPERTRAGWSETRVGKDVPVEHKPSQDERYHIDYSDVGIKHTSTVLTDWRPNQRLFAPTKGDVDPRLFDESNRQMLPRVRSEILSLTDGFFASHGYGVRPSWARVFLAGSQASEWWGNRDFDILIGINYPLFRDARPQDAALSDKEVDDRFNVQLRDDFNDDTWHPDFDPDEAWSRTGYVNHDSWHIAKIHPYAAYDVTDGEWAVTPIHEPQGHTFADSEWYYFEGVAEQARHALALTGSARTQACSRLWEFVHSDRSRAFGAGGSGAFDYRNALEKYLSQCSVNQANTESNSDDDSLMQALANVRYGKGQKTAASEVESGAEPYLHATDVLFHPGEIIYPTSATGVKTRYNSKHNPHYSPDHVYMYRAGETHEDFRQQGGAVYEVRPHGPVERDPEPWRGRPHAPGSYRTRGPATVVRMVRNDWKDPAARIPEGMRGDDWKPSEQPRPVPVPRNESGKEQKTAAAGPDASLWPKHPVFQQGDRVTVSYGNGSPGSPGTVHHMVPSDSPDHEPTAWVTEDRDKERYGDRPIGVSQSRVQIHPDAPAEQHEHHQQQVAKNESGEPYVPEHERNIDENDRVTVHHLTGDPHFTPSSAHRPENNTTMGGSMSPRLFVGDAHSWAEGEYGYRRPYVAEISAPRAVVQNNGGYSGEKEIHARHFDKIQVKRVMPYDAHVRERYGVHGPAESYHGTTFDTDKKITPEQQRDADHGKRNFPVGYKWSGDTRNWSQQQHQEHVTRHNQYLKGAHGWDIEDDHDWGTHHESVLRRQAVKTAGLFGSSWYETAHDDDIDDHPAAEQIRGHMTHHTSPQGHVYRLTHDSSKYVTATYLGKGSNRIKKPQMVGRLSYFGGQANDNENISGRIHKVFVKPAHRRRGLASAMLDHARAMKKPGDDIEHSSALSEDGKAWSDKKASRTAGANGDLPDLHYQFHDANETGEDAHHVEAWLPEHAGDWSECAPDARSVYHGSFLDPGHRPVGSISWDHQTGEIRGVYAVDEHKRKGVASELLRRAREIDPTVHHSEHLSDSGRAWSSKVGKTASVDWDVTREYDPGYVGKFGHRYVLTAKDSDGNQQGRLRYHEPKRKGAPLHVDEVRGDAPGAASHLLNHMESLHPDASKTVFFGEKDARRHHNTPSHHDGEHGKPTDWDQHYDALGDIHRGLSIRLDSRDARTVNSPDHPAADHAKVLQGKIAESNAGIHWTAGAREAKNFAGRNQFDPRTDIPVVLHAHKPARKDIETRPGELFRNGTFPHDHVEKEVPVRRGRELALTGISWKPDSPHPEADEDGWLHHTFDEPIVKRARLSSSGYLDLYHRTTPEAADSIVSGGGFTSKEHRHDGQPVYFSTHLHGGEGEGYGSAAVHVRVPERLAELDDEFPDGEQHYAVPSHKIRPEHIVGRVASSSGVASVEDDPARWGADGWRAREMKRSTLRETHQNGEYTYHHAPGPLNDDEEGYGNIYVTHGDDPHNVVGESYYGPHPSRQGHLELASRVAPEHRRKGVATGMYDFAERLTGKATAPADVNSEQAQGFWRNRMKENR